MKMGVSDRGESNPHQPVLYQLSLDSLQPLPAGRYVDATVGAGGHASGILERCAPDGLLLGLDLDEKALSIAEKRLERFGNRAILFRASYTQMEDFVARCGWTKVNGVFFDLGVSSMQLDMPEKGFSFMRDGPLDMRFNSQQSRSAELLVNQTSEKDLAEIIWKFGEERQSRKIARAICLARPISGTLHLANVITKALGNQRARQHPATRTFQALRMSVNDELVVILEGLKQAVAVLKPGGRLVVVTFHSLEDRLVKQFFKDESVDCICPPGQPMCTCKHRAGLRIITKHPLKPGREEVQQNPRARSAKLRVAERI